MFDIHIEEFYLDCCKILNQLYQSFPKKRAVFVEDISGADQPDEYGVHSDRFLSCFGAMIWLADEGFIQFETTIRQEAIDEACLTSQGLRLLSAITRLPELDDLREKLASDNPSLTFKPNIDTLRLLMRKGTSTQLGVAMHHLLHEHKQT